MKSSTFFLSKILACAFLTSVLFKHFLSPHNWNNPFILYLLWFILLLPAFIAFIKFGSAILINTEIDKELNYKNELFKLALFITVNIWMINFFLFTLLGNLWDNHFHTIPFLSALTLGIYFFKKNNNQELPNEDILDDDFNFKKINT
ncbi:MAG: hypothetical protein AB8F94_24415 [Saprospiraceae bacterium]